jgi:16S rRNA C967 or C1407 C5-methylase (RsmB/RsmF family)
MLHRHENIAVEPFGHGISGLTSFGGIEFDGQLKKARRFYPHLHDTMGFFIARLRMG